MLLPITLAVKRHSCIHRTFPLSHQRERQNDAAGKGGGMPDPKLASPPNFNAFPGLRAAALQPGVCLSPGGDPRGWQWLFREGLGSVPHLSAAGRARALPAALPPRRLSHRALPPASPLLPSGRVGQRW